MQGMATRAATRRAAAAFLPSPTHTRGALRRLTADARRLQVLNLTELLAAALPDNQRLRLLFGTAPAAEPTMESEVAFRMDASRGHLSAALSHGQAGPDDALRRNVAWHYAGSLGSSALTATAGELRTLQRHGPRLARPVPAPVPSAPLLPPHSPGVFWEPCPTHLKLRVRNIIGDGSWRLPSQDVGPADVPTAACGGRSAPFCVRKKPKRKLLPMRGVRGGRFCFIFVRKKLKRKHLDRLVGNDAVSLRSCTRTHPTSVLPVAPAAQNLSSRAPIADLAEAVSMATCTPAHSTSVLAVAPTMAIRNLAGEIIFVPIIDSAMKPFAIKIRSMMASPEGAAEALAWLPERIRPQLDDLLAMSSNMQLLTVGPFAQKCSDCADCDNRCDVCMGGPRPVGFAPLPFENFLARSISGGGGGAASAKADDPALEEDDFGWDPFDEDAV